MLVFVPRPTHVPRPTRNRRATRNRRPSRGRRRPALTALALATLAAAVLTAGCGGSSGASSGRPLVVAGENFWGSLAAQLGGNRVQTRSIIINPSTDPHSYQPTAADGRLLAQSRLAIVNGVGYDSWAPKLLAANPAGSRVVLNVGDLVGAHEGDNPHRWYNPANVQAVVGQIVTDLKRIAPGDAAYFDQRQRALETQGLARYHQLIASTRARYAGVPVGASESIFAMQAPALGLNLITPAGYMKAISEGTDPSAADKATVDRQITSRQIKVWIYNSQNTTPDVQRLTTEARRAGIPVATVTETLQPPTASFEEWQSSQLIGIQQALARATGR
jgi:zinc/manganese transport system substrate-binding protein